MENTFNPEIFKENEQFNLEKFEKDLQENKDNFEYIKQIFVWMLTNKNDDFKQVKTKYISIFKKQITNTEYLTRLLNEEYEDTTVLDYLYNNKSFVVFLQNFGKQNEFKNSINNYVRKNLEQLFKEKKYKILGVIFINNYIDNINLENIKEDIIIEFMNYAYTNNKNIMFFSTFNTIYDNIQKLNNNIFPNLVNKLFNNALQNNNFSLIENLFKRKKNNLLITKETEKKYELLLCAIKSKNINIIESIINYCNDDEKNNIKNKIHILDENEKTLFIKICKITNKETIAQIIQILNNLNITFEQKDIEYLFEYSIKNNNFDCINVLLQINNFDKTILTNSQIEDILFFVCKNNDIKFFNMFFDFIGEEKIIETIQAFDKQKQFDLLFYTIYDRTNELNINNFNKVLKIFKQIKSEEEIKELINMPDKNGITLFKYACKYGNKEIINQLVQYVDKEELIKKDSNGLTLFDIFQIYNYNINKKDYENIALLLNNGKAYKYNPDINYKLYKQDTDKFKRLTIRFKQLAFDINYMKNLIEEYIKDEQQNVERQSLVENTIFCEQDEIANAIKILQEKIGNSDNIGCIRSKKKAHNYSIVVSKDTILSIDSCVNYFNGIKDINKNTKMYVIGDKMQADGISCGIFSIELLLTLNNYLKETGLTLREFIEETIKKGKFIDGDKSELENDIMLTNFCKRLKENNVQIIPIPEIFAYIIQKSHETIEKIFENKDLEQSKTLLYNGKTINDYVHKIKELIAYNIVNETQEISREEFNEKIKEYKNKKTKLDKIDKRLENKLFQGYSEEHDILIEADKNGNTKIYITELTEKEKKERENKNPFIECLEEFNVKTNEMIR